MMQMENFFSARLWQVVALTMLLPVLAGGAPATREAPLVPGELLIKLKSGATVAAAQASLQQLGLKEARQFSGSMSGLAVYELSESARTEEVLAQLKGNPLVQYAQPNYLVRLHDPVDGNHALSSWSDSMVASFCRTGEQSLPCKNIFSSFADRPAIQPPPPDVSPAIPDPGLNQQYGLSLIQANRAWSQMPGSRRIVVAVIDSGIDYNHEDLSANMWRNPHPSEKNDLVGFDTLSHNGMPYDDDEVRGHGTHAAGIAGAVGGNGKGISGVNQRVSLMALKAFSAYAFGSTESCVEAIAYAVDHGAQIISASWATAKKDNPALIDAIEQARAKGVLFVAAAGNSHNDDDKDETAEYPAGYHIDNIVAVASVDSENKLAESSGYGLTTVLLGAPGVNIYSTLPGKQMYGWESGTSMATPHVAGAAAMVWAQNPQWNYLQVKQALASSVDMAPDLAGKTISGGRLNVWKALQVHLD